MTRQRPRPADSEASLSFNVSTLLAEPIGSQRRHTIAEAPFTFNGFVTRVAGTVDFLRTDGSIMVTADLSLHIEEICGRCLRPFVTPFTVRFSEEFWPAFDPLTRERVHVPEEREGFPISDGHLDLGEAIRQYVEMARSMRPLCGRPACPAVAEPVPLDRRDEAAVDSRWAALQTLRDHLNE